ncbi:MAG: HpsJ family protein [Xenococcaceae cyanobacterium MO_207.B15]|nr:HpsJ family protein [Xenococcaceae cyanobacterium MO_207.B15]
MLKYYLWKLRKDLKFQPKTSTKAKILNAIVEQKSSKIINLVGYTILFLVLLDYAALLISPKFFNPVWGWETAGKLVETVWAPLLGFLFIFYRRDQDLIKPRELTFLSLLSWLALILGTIYLLIAPVLIGNAFRINRSQKAQVTNQISQQKTQVQQYSQKLEQVSKEQLNNLLQAYQQQAPDIAISSSQQLKENLLTQINQRQQTAQKQLQNNFSQQKINLIKTTFKWLIGAIISGVSFILIWSYTQWARVLHFTKP